MTAVYFQYWKKMLLALITLIAFSLPETEAYVVICKDNSIQTNTINGEVVTEFKMPGMNLDPNLCTHYIYNSIYVNSSYHIENYTIPFPVLNGVKQMKTKNPNLKILVGVDGLDSQERPASTKEIADLSNSLNDYLFENTFDGVELSLLGSEVTKGLFQPVIKDLRELLAMNGFSLGIYFQSFTGAETYNWTALLNMTDFIALQTTDLFTSFNSPMFATHPHPLKQDKSNEASVDKIVTAWTSLGVPANKLVITIPTEGQRWKLSSNVTTPPAPATRLPMNDPNYFNEMLSNQLTYRNICQHVKSGKWEKFSDLKNNSGPYAVSSNNSSPRYWVGYDDPQMASVKAEYIKTKNLFGACVMIASNVFVNSTDDYDNSCGDGFYPIATAVSKVLMSSTGPTTDPPTPVTTAKPTTENSTVTTTSPTTANSTVTTASPTTENSTVTTTRPTTANSTVTTARTTTANSAVTTNRPKTTTTTKPIKTTPKPKTTTTKPRKTTPKPNKTTPKPKTTTTKPKTTRKP